MEQKINNAFVGRTDGYIDAGVDASNPIVQTWIHKEVIKKIGEGEDDWVVVEKPVLVDEVNIDKTVHELAKGTDLKSLIKEVLRTGDETILHKTEVQAGYVDATVYPKDTIEALNLMRDASKKAKDVGLDALTKEAIDKYVEKLLEEKTKNVEKVDVQPNTEVKENV